MLANLRVETAERLMAAGIDLDWTVEADVFPVLDAKSMYSLRSIIREAASNVVRHADARQMIISLCYRDGIISLLMEDDGVGLDPDHVIPGNGLANIEQRVTGLQGTFQFLPRAPGTCLVAQFTMPHTTGANAGEPA
jgi:signal transduction histidine kinase